MQRLLTHNSMATGPPTPPSRFWLIILFSILLLQDYLVFPLFLLFPPTLRPLEMLAAVVWIPPASASWESAALWFKQQNPSVSLILYINRKWRPYCCRRMLWKCLFFHKDHLICHFWHVKESAAWFSHVKEDVSVSGVSFFLCALFMREWLLKCSQWDPS